MRSGSAASVQLFVSFCVSYTSESESERADREFGGQPGPFGLDAAPCGSPLGSNVYIASTVDGDSSHAFLRRIYGEL